MDLSEIVTRDLHPFLIWLGKVDDWYITEKSEDSSFACKARINWDVLKNLPGYERYKPYLYRLEQDVKNTFLAVLYFSWVETIKNGPKLFRPSVEQFESMMNVDLNIPVSQYRQPYSGMVVQVPDPCRRFLAEKYKLPSWSILPRYVIVAQNFGSNEELYTTITVVHRFQGEDYPFHIHERPQYENLEAQLRHVEESYTNNSDVEGIYPDYNFRYRAVTARAALNLLVMLCHYGHTEPIPLNPQEYTKHRTKKYLEHLKHGDFLAVDMKQDVVIRSTPAFPQNPEGHGTGVEVKPHWRRGHWRAYPGQGNLRAAGQKVPLLFIRPCLVRHDRIIGDVSESVTNYRVD